MRISDWSSDVCSSDLARFYGTFASALEETVPPPGRIAVASQSGGYGGYLMRPLFLRGLGISQWVTPGNGADLDVGEAPHWKGGRDGTAHLRAEYEGLGAEAKLAKGKEHVRTPA